ncbi:hypothetical protein PINS_up002006 [Pythium insidiosum]|nr:hypothetical protein PINS_up002006 [Pythium insidiosum]
MSFYGYHDRAQLFVKIFLYNPRTVSTVVQLLESGCIAERKFQCFESHIPFLLQVFADYSIEGMNNVHLSNVKFRAPLPASQDHLQAITDASDVHSRVFLRSTVPSEKVNGSIDAIAQVVKGRCIEQASIHPVQWFDRQSTCALEIDVAADSILNPKMFLVLRKSLGQRGEQRSVPSLAVLWEEERLRRMEIGEELLSESSPSGDVDQQIADSGGSIPSSTSSLMSQSFFRQEMQESLAKIVKAHTSMKEKELRESTTGDIGSNPTGGVRFEEPPEEIAHENSLSPTDYVSGCRTSISTESAFSYSQIQLDLNENSDAATDTMCAKQYEDDKRIMDVLLAMQQSNNLHETNDQAPSHEEVHPESGRRDNCVPDFDADEAAADDNEEDNSSNDIIDILSSQADTFEQLENRRYESGPSPAISATSQWWEIVGDTLKKNDTEHVEDIGSSRMKLVSSTREPFQTASMPSRTKTEESEDLSDIEDLLPPRPVAQQSPLITPTKQRPIEAGPTQGEEAYPLDPLFASLTPKPFQRTQAKNTHRSPRNRINMKRLWMFAPHPPSIEDAVASSQKLQIETFEYPEAYYSKKCDIPDKPLVFGGRKYEFKSRDIKYARRFDTQPLRAKLYQHQNVASDETTFLESMHLCAGDVKRNNDTTPIGQMPQPARAESTNTDDKPVLSGESIRNLSWDTPSTRKWTRYAGLEVLLVQNEEDLFEQLIRVLQHWDPDFFVGFEVQKESLGYLIDRASQLQINLIQKLSRLPANTIDARNISSGPTDHPTTQPDGDEEDNSSERPPNTSIGTTWGITKASGLWIYGRHVLNLWRLARSELKLSRYSREDVIKAVLKRDFPVFSSADLTSLFQSGGESMWKVIRHVLARSVQNLRVLSQMQLITRTSEMARLFGMDFYSVLSRGSQFRVESVMLRVTKRHNFVLRAPNRTQVAAQAPMECIPLVMEPHSTFYPDPVVVLDFQSLYPSLVIAYNLCYSTMYGRLGEGRQPVIESFLGVDDPFVPSMDALCDDHENLVIAPNGTLFSSKKRRLGILPVILDEILSTRIMVKKAMGLAKRRGDTRLEKVLNARQLALKMIANVTYGYTAAGFSGRMPCAQLADSIVQSGRSTLESAVRLVEGTSRWNARVVYGDTDSLFVLLRGRSKHEAFRIGQEIADAVTAANPRPVTLKMEKVYMGCVLVSKKRSVLSVSVMATMSSAPSPPHDSTSFAYTPAPTPPPISAPMPVHPSPSVSGSARYDALLQQIVQLNSDLQKTAALSQLLQRERDGFAHNNQKLKDEVKRLHDRCERLQNVLVQETEQKIESDRKHEELIAKWKKQLELKTRAFEVLQKKLAPPRDLEQLRIQIQEQLEEPHQQRLAAMQGEIDKQRAISFELRREYETIKAEYEQYAIDQGNEMECLHTTYESRITDLRKKLQSAEDAVRDSQHAETIRRLEHQRDAAQVEVKLLHQEIRDLRDELKRVQDRAATEQLDVESRLADELTRCATMELDLKAAMRQLALATDDCTSWRSKWDDSQAKLLSTSHELDKVRDQLKQKEQLILSSHHTVNTRDVLQLHDEIQMEKEQVDIKLRYAEQDVTDLRDQLDKLREEFAHKERELQHKCASTDAEARAQRSALRLEMRQALTKTLRELSKTQKKRDAYKQKCLEIHERYKSLLEELQRQDATVAQMQRDHSSELQHVLAQLAQLENDKTELQQRYLFARHEPTTAS